MAHAARLNLRMQKELQLLLTDPPPGVSLSTDGPSDISLSLSSIDAVIKGPEGTVYANGVFKIKIQIPDRYPFQPPNVTFATPIYHPNIDNGGRICLDILNLPPKGAWQPSLNISTVLMSIGLLLSEPNPDDGLMCEASREYKYNRQTFDQKARSMTEKYARLGIAASSSSNGGTPVNPNPLMMEVEGHDSELRNVDNECTVDHKNLSRVSRKLSLETSVPVQMRNDETKDEVAHTDTSAFLYSESRSAHASTVLPMQQDGIDDEQPSHQASSSKVGSGIMNLSPKKFSGKVKKLSLKSSVPPSKAANNEMEIAQIQCSHTASEVVSVTSSDLFQPSISNHFGQQSNHDNEVDADSDSGNQSRKLVSAISGRLASNSSCSPQRRKVDERSVLHTRKSISPSGSQKQSSATSSKSHLMPLSGNHNGKQPPHKKANKDITNMSSKKSGIKKKLSLEFSSKSKWEDDENKENVPPNYQSTLGNPSIASSSFMVPQEEPPHQDYNQGAANGRSVIGNKKPFGTSKVSKQSLGLTRRRDADKKVVKLPVERLSPLHHQSLNEVSAKSVQLCVDAHDEEKSGNSNKKQAEEESSLVADAVIVLDSEDSEEEVKGPTRSRLSLARKPLAGKRKANS